MHQASIAGLACALALGWSATARATPPASPELEWDAPAGCPNREQVRRSIERWLQRSVEDVDARALRVHAEVQREGDHWTLALQLESPSGRAQARLTAKECATLAEVVGMQVALAADSAGTVYALDPAQARPRRDALRSAVRVLAGAATGPLPQLGGSFGLAGMLGFGAVRFELGVAYAPPAATSYPSLPEVGARFSLFSGTARGCLEAALGALRLPLCVGVELGALRATGFGTERRFTTDRLFAAIVLGPALRLPLLDPLFAWLELDALLVIARPGYRMRNLATLYRPDPAAARALMGLELEF
jgi:hypothetical protein